MSFAGPIKPYITFTGNCREAIEFYKTGSTPEKTYWAKAFGMVTDKFGIKWLINCEGPG